MKTLLLLTAILGFSLQIRAETTVYTPEHLDQLVGPIALYPDPLVAVILPASTFPDDIALAANYLEAKYSFAGIQAQSWNDSVKALARYPSVLNMLNDSPEWTDDLGNAFEEHPADVMRAIQRQRARAWEAGTLVDTPQQRIYREGEFIRITPVSVDTIYVPVYDPQVVYVRQTRYIGPCMTFGVGYSVGYWLGYHCDWDQFGIWQGPWTIGWGYRREWRHPNYDHNRWRAWCPEPRRFPRPQGHQWDPRHDNRPWDNHNDHRPRNRDGNHGNGDHRLPASKAEYHIRDNGSPRVSTQPATNSRREHRDQIQNQHREHRSNTQDQVNRNQEQRNQNQSDRNQNQVERNQNQEQRNQNQVERNHNQTERNQNQINRNQNQERRNQNQEQRNQNQENRVQRNTQVDHGHKNRTDAPRVMPQPRVEPQNRTVVPQGRTAPAVAPAPKSAPPAAVPAPASTVAPVRTNDGSSNSSGPRRSDRH